MAVPQLGSISPFNIGASQGSEMGSALGSAPDVFAQEQLKQMVVKQQKAQALQQMLKSIYPQLSAAPNDPRLQKEVQQDYRQAGQSTAGLITPGHMVQDPAQPSQGAQPGGAPPQGGQSGGAPAQPSQHWQGDQLNLAALGIRRNASEVAAPEYQALMAMTPQSRKPFLDQMDAVPADWYTLPLQLDVKGKADLRKEFDDKFSKVAQGLESPQSISKWIDVWGDALPQIGANVSQLANDPEAIAGMGAYTKAKVAALAQAGGWTQARIAKAYADIDSQKSLEAQRYAYAKYLGAKQLSLSVTDSAAMMNAQAHAQAAQASMDKVQQDIANSLHGTWSQRVAASQSNRKIIIDIQSKAAADLTNLKRIQQAAQANNEDITGGSEDNPGLDLLGAISTAQQNLDDANAAMKTLNNPNYKADGITRSLNQSGVSTMGRAANLHTNDKPAATLKGKPIYLNKAGDGYEYADGTAAK